LCFLISPDVKVVAISADAEIATQLLGQQDFERGCLGFLANFAAARGGGPGCDVFLGL